MDFHFFYFNGFGTSRPSHPSYLYLRPQQVPKGFRPNTGMNEGCQEGKGHNKTVTCNKDKCN